MERKVDDEVDRLSELPEFVVQHILSFLPTKQVVQSTLFSKTWKHVWTTFPLLRFDKTFSSDSWYEVDRKKPDIQRKLVNFYNFVETTLRRHHRLKLRIKNFKLTDVLHKHKSMSRVDRWIRYVVESDVEELNLLIGFCGIHYCLPNSVLFAKSLTVLTLRMCKLVSMCDCGDINLPSLKKLSLSSVYGDDQIIQNLLAGCPVIECIIFDSCRGIKSIKIFGVPKVMVIRIQGNRGLERLELEASNNLYDLCINERLQVQPEQLDLLSFINLEVLSIRASCITNEWLHDHLLELPFLEDLQLLGMNWERLNISSHRLKSLDLFVCNNLVELNIDAPKLCRFQYLGVYIKCFSSNALALREALYTMIISDDPTDIEKIAFLSKLSNSKLLELDIDFAKSVILAKELRECIPSPSYNVKHLKLSISSFTRRDISELVDNLLWISPRPDILSIECISRSAPEFDKISIKFTYEMPIYKGENPSCCKFLPFPCWRHCLKTIKIDSLTGYADIEILYMYFSENTKTLEDFQFHVGAIA